jgi:hypothetical protein
MKWPAESSRHSGAAFHRKCIEIFVARCAGLSGWIIAIPLSHPKSERLTGTPELIGIGGFDFMKSDKEFLSREVTRTPSRAKGN